ncbi:MAG: DUF4351 domain-containing protein, partial [Bacillota bacterium]|nr:DUF4351 domain-containing protein [Bacillota bacterium]
IYGKFGNIEEEIVNMVKSFYDPKVEEKGIEKGIEKGMEKGKKIGMEQGAKKSNELLIKLLVKRFGNLPEDLKSKIMSLPIDKVNEIGESIFDFNILDDIYKFLN